MNPQVIELLNSIRSVKSDPGVRNLLRQRAKIKEDRHFLRNFYESCKIENPQQPELAKNKEELRAAILKAQQSKLIKPNLKKPDIFDLEDTKPVATVAKAKPAEDDIFTL